MLWACIIFPQLALDGVLRTQPDDQQPLVLVGGSPQQPVIKAANPAARQRGLRPGLGLNAARAMSNDFICRPYDLASIQHWQQFLAGWAYGFSSQVSLHYPRCLLVEVGSSLRLFGPWPQLQTRWRHELAELGFGHRISLAPNPVAARVLASSGDGLALTEPGELTQALASLPIEHLGLGQAACRALKGMGVRRLQQLLALPRDALARRFGAELLLQLDRLLGHAPLALDFYRPAQYFDARLELNYEVSSSQALLFPLRRLLQDLASYLLSLDQGVQRFTLYLQHRQRPDSLLEVGLLNAERDPALLLELSKARLERLPLPAPVLALRLRAEQLPAYQPQHLQLFDHQPEGGSPWQLLCERLRARLGDDTVQQLSARSDHRPERTWQLAGSTTTALLTPSGPRPAWLLRQPRPIANARLLSGPERIESGWWDGNDIRRDYFQIQTPEGAKGWAFRNLGKDSPLLLQGWFA